MDDKSASTVVAYDICGYPYNKKYPPGHSDKYHGYPDPYRETLFYDFAVQGYDLEFSYKGQAYYCLVGDGYVALCDEHFNTEFQRFSDGNDFIEHFEIGGKTLLELIDDLDWVQPM